MCRMYKLMMFLFTFFTLVHCATAAAALLEDEGKIDDAIEEDFVSLGEGTTTTDDFNFISEKVKNGISAVECHHRSNLVSYR